MNTVHVTASRSYDVLIGSGLLSTVGQRAAAMGNVKKVCIVSESTVWPLYGASVRKSLSDAGLETCEFIFPAGENSKNGPTFLSLLNFLAECRLTRAELSIPLGG